MSHIDIDDAATDIFPVLRDEAEETTAPPRRRGRLSRFGLLITGRVPAPQPEPVLPDPDHNPSEVHAPADDEVYSYLGPQMRWVQLFLVASFVLAGWSLYAFAESRAWLYPVLVVLGLNVIGTLLSVITGLNTRRVNWRSHQELVSSWRGTPTVDIFLPTCGEDIAILRNSYDHHRALTWSGWVRFYVLDDADRSEVRSLAKEYGFTYVVRPDRGHLRKAGNLRHAFTISSSEFVVIFDADFCPRPDFLAHLIPYFDDPTVGIVQSPQAFSTTQSMHWIQRTAGATQEFFYRWVQPSRDRLDAATCVGTSAVYRRTALETIGGFAEIAHSEDLHTGIHMLQAGFHTRYIPVVISRGLCPSDLGSFVNQQYRWCQGSLSRLQNPHLEGARRRRTVRQVLAYWAGLLYYVTTALNVFLLFIPAMIMLTFYPEDVRPVQLVPFLLGLWVYMVLFPLVSRTRWRFDVLRIQMAYSYAHMVAIGHRLIGRDAGWVPTGVVGSSNRLGRTISWLGALTIGFSLIVFWVVIVYDIAQYGLARFWMMLGFVWAYTYLAAPLFVEFVRVLRGSRGPRYSRSSLTGTRPPVAPDRVAPTERNEDAAYRDHSHGSRYTRSSLAGTRPSIGTNWNRITGYEVIGYSSAILFIAALALGWFDIVLPWDTP